MNLIPKRLASAMDKNTALDGYYFMDVHERVSDRAQTKLKINYQREWTIAALPKEISNTGAAIFLADQSGNIFVKKVNIKPRNYPLWSKILAGEANTPGTFSKQTINILSNLDKTDAQSFDSICRYIGWIKEEDQPIILMFDSANSIFDGLRSHQLKHLSDLGLINIAESMTLGLRLPPVLFPIRGDSGVLQN